MLRAFPVRRFRVGQAVDDVDLAGRGPAGELVDARLGDEQLAGLPVEPFVRLRARRPPPCTPTSAVNAMSYSPGSGLSSSYSIPATPSASLAASSAAPARSAPPVDSRMESIASTAFAHPDSLSTRLRVCSPRCVSVCPADPAIPATGPATRHAPGCWARTRACRTAAPTAWTGPRCSCRPGRTPGDGSPGACPTSRGPRASRARRPTTGSLPAFARSAEQRCRPRARPRRTGRPSYAATRPRSKRFPGNGSSAARSSENRPRSSVLFMVK